MYTFNQLNHALDTVQDELIEHGFWDRKLSRIEVLWVPYGTAYGFQNYFTQGEIVIPGISLAKAKEWFKYPYVSLKDILRHEYGHAFAYTHKKLMRTDAFRAAFGTHHDDLETSWEYDPERFISEYAATNAMEDFAETFMYYLEYSGQLPSRHNHRAIRKKWGYVKSLSRLMKGM
jgi:hypothetical protein